MTLPTPEPLASFYLKAGTTPPVFEEVDGSTMPQPYRRLLVHDGDMTSRLQSHHDALIRIEALNVEQSADRYQREVVLKLVGSGKPVEYGAIEIHLDVFHPGVRKLIVEARYPLGGLLKEFEIEHWSEPSAFIRTVPDERIRTVLASDATSMYGRCNTLRGAAGQTIATIVEILPPEENGL